MTDDPTKAGWPPGTPDVQAADMRPAGGSPPPCTHENIKANVEVTALTHHPGAPVEAYTAEVRVWCEDCEEPFVWMGLPLGLNGQHPTSSLDQQELRAPLRPKSAPDTFGSQMSYTVELPEGQDR